MPIHAGNPAKTQKAFGSSFGIFQRQTRRNGQNYEIKRSDDVAYSSHQAMMGNFWVWTKRTKTSLKRQAFPIKCLTSTLKTQNMLEKISPRQCQVKSINLKSKTTFGAENIFFRFEKIWQRKSK